ncbi:unnamed protein product [Prorocentrum cordatum]|uniref:Helicase C-terminal domain-containing protein n=1 Tax=Prorocentrum cordatum TaxID=2364126 RepID=A0ABN9RNQ3_9DINO|nr:unnamed protein product [Polarella glacialis]
MKVASYRALCAAARGGDGSALTLVVALRQLCSADPRDAREGAPEPEACEGQAHEAEANEWRGPAAATRQHPEDSAGDFEWARRALERSGPRLESGAAAAHAASAKLLLLGALLRWARRAVPEEAFVVVSGFTRSLRRCSALCQDLGIPADMLSGSTPIRSRLELVSAFNAGRGCRVMLLSSRAGGVGLNIVGASRLVLLEPDWNPAVDQQAAARVWRQGQRRRVFVYRLAAHGTLEERVLRRQARKRGLASAALEPDEWECGAAVDDALDLRQICALHGYDAAGAPIPWADPAGAGPSVDAATLGEAGGRPALIVVLNAIPVALPTEGNAVAMARAADAAAAGTERGQSARDYQDMRHDLRDWTAHWFHGDALQATDEASLQEQCEALLGAMLLGASYSVYYNIMAKTARDANDTDQRAGCGVGPWKFGMIAECVSLSDMPWSHVEFACKGMPRAIADSRVRRAFKSAGFLDAFSEDSGERLAVEDNANARISTRDGNKLDNVTVVKSMPDTEIARRARGNTSARFCWRPRGSRGLDGVCQRGPWLMTGQRAKGLDIGKMLVRVFGGGAEARPPKLGRCDADMGALARVSGAISDGGPSVEFKGDVHFYAHMTWEQLGAAVFQKQVQLLQLQVEQSASYAAYTCGFPDPACCRITSDSGCVTAWSWVGLGCDPFPPVRRDVARTRFKVWSLRAAATRVAEDSRRLRATLTEAGMKRLCAARPAASIAIAAGLRRTAATRPARLTVGKQAAAEAAIARGQATRAPAAARAAAKRPAAASAQRRRHDGPAQMLEEEAASWAERRASDDLGDGENCLECLFARASSRGRAGLAIARRPARRSSCLACLPAPMTDDQKQATRQAPTAVARALRDHDFAAASHERCAHGSRARKLMVQWASFAALPARGSPSALAASTARRSQTMSALALDIMESNAARSFFDGLEVKGAGLGGLRPLSVDAAREVAVKTSGCASSDMRDVSTVLGVYGESVGPNAPLRSRLEFCRLLANFVAVYTGRLDANCG